MDSIDDAGIPTNEEIERALRRAWFPVARVADLGEPRRVELLGETLAVYLTDDGAPHVVARSLRASRRVAVRRPRGGRPHRLPLPRLAVARRTTDAASTSRRSAKARDIPSKAVAARLPRAGNAGGSSGAASTSRRSLPAPPALDGIDWTHAPGRPMTLSAGPRAATENFRDVAHFPFVHQEHHGPPARGGGAAGGRAPGHRGVPHARVQRERRRRGNVAGADEFSYHAIAPSFVCLRMQHDERRRRYSSTRRRRTRRPPTRAARRRRFSGSRGHAWTTPR